MSLAQVPKRGEGWAGMLGVDERGASPVPRPCLRAFGTGSEKLKAHINDISEASKTLSAETTRASVNEAEVRGLKGGWLAADRTELA